MSGPYGTAYTPPGPPPYTNGSPYGMMASGNVMNGSMNPIGAGSNLAIGMGSPLTPPSTGHNGRLGPGITDPHANDWKLFVGQVPFECIEQDLWPMFAELGDILELVILR